MEKKQKDKDETIIQNFQQLLEKHQPKANTNGHKQDNAPKPPGSETSFRLRLLMLLPWVLAGGFVFSLFWDFDGYTIYIGTWETSLQGLLRLVTISGLIGFTTNWLAIQMLFYPREKHPILGQGLVPAQKQRIAYRLAEAVEKDLINKSHIRERLSRDGELNKLSEGLIRFMGTLTSNPEFRSDLRTMIDDYIKESLDDPEVRARIREKARIMIENGVDGSRLEKTAIRLYMLFKGKNLDTMLDEAIAVLPEKLGPALDPVDELIDSLPARLRSRRKQVETVFLTVLERLLDSIDIRKIVEDNLNSYDEIKLEKMIRGATNAHLNYIKYLGALIGMVGGFVIWNPLVSLLIIFLIATLIYLLDYTMMQSRKPIKN